MRCVLLALLFVAIPACAARQRRPAPAVAAAPGEPNADSAESQMIAARAHLEMGCPTDATYHVSRQGGEYQVAVKYVMGYGPKREPILATDRGALVVLDQQGKLVRIDRNHPPGAQTPDQAVASDSQPGTPPAAS